MHRVFGNLWMGQTETKVGRNSQASCTLCRRNLKTGFSLWKHIKCFPSTLRQRNLKTEVSLWKCIKSVPSTLRQRNLKKQLSLVILELCLKKSLTRKSNDYRDVILFEKLHFWDCFPFTLKRKASVFKFLRFEVRFRKDLFSWPINVDGRPNHRSRAAFPNFSDVVWTGTRPFAGYQTFFNLSENASTKHLSALLSKKIAHKKHMLREKTNAQCWAPFVLLIPWS